MNPKKNWKGSKLKSVVTALAANHHLQILNWKISDDSLDHKTYFEARCLLHNMEVNLNLAWEKFKDLDEALDEFFKKCSGIVAAMKKLEAFETEQNVKVLSVKYFIQLESPINIDQIEFKEEMENANQKR